VRETAPDHRHDNRHTRNIGTTTQPAEHRHDDGTGRGRPCDAPLNPDSRSDPKFPIEGPKPTKNLRVVARTTPTDAEVAVIDECRRHTRPIAWEKRRPHIATTIGTRGISARQPAAAEHRHDDGTGRGRPRDAPLNPDPRSGPKLFEQRTQANKDFTGRRKDDPYRCRGRGD
jgi:hypothetical protein